MSTVKADTDLLRKAGRDTVAAAEPLSTIQTVPQAAVNGETVNLMGAGEPFSAGGRTQISTAGFPPGTEAQQALAGVIGRFTPAPPEIQNNARALSSALHIVADLYTTTDHENAVEFAFVNPAAKRPDGLPFYINPKRTFESLRNNTTPQSQGDNSKNANKQQEPRGDDSSHTQQNPRTEERRIPMRGEGGIAQRYETIHYDKKGNPTRIDVVDYERDGAARFYSLTPDKNGGFKRTEEFYVGPQPPVTDLTLVNKVRSEELKKMVDETTSGF